jgi:hypothetical protein
VAAPGCVPTGHMVTGASVMTGEHQDHKEENHNDEHDPEHLHPPWRSGVEFRTGIALRISHL